MGVRVNLRGIRGDLAKACGGLGFHLYDTLPGDLETPAIVIPPPDTVKFTHTLGAGGLVSIVAIVVVGRADDEQAQKLLDDVLSGLLLEHLAGAESRHWMVVQVVEARNIRTQTAGGAEVLACDLALEIITT
jgi:hypothetical protein